MLYKAGKVGIALFFIIIKIGSIMHFENTAHRNWKKEMRDGIIVTHQKLRLHFAFSLMFVVYTKNRT